MWLEACGRASAKLTLERRMATEALSTAESSVLTSSSCGERTGRRHRASANVTWVEMSDLMSSGMMKGKACGFGCKG